LLFPSNAHSFGFFGRFKLDPQLKLMDVVEKIPFTYTGADFYALCTDAMMNSIKRKIDLVESRVGLRPFLPSFLPSFLAFYFFT